MDKSTDRDMKGTNPIVSDGVVFAGLASGLLNLVENFGGNSEAISWLITSEGRNTFIAVARLIVGGHRSATGGRQIYKNWPKICEVLRGGPYNKQVAGFNAMIDPSFCWLFAIFFPEFWGDTEFSGPIPWSVLVEADKNYLKEAVCSIADYEPKSLFSHGVIEEFGLSSKMYFAPDVFGGGYEPVLPIGIERIPKVGDTVEFGGEKLVLVEDDKLAGTRHLVFVPAEFIATDL